jgi:RNA polymerase sigma-70 factor (ECF subfamily)
MPTRKKQAGSTKTGRLDPKTWIAEHGDVLYRYAFFRVYDTAAAEDLVQETLLAGWTARARFRGEAQERTWLIGILKRKVIDHLRRRTREQPLGDIAEDDDAVDRLFRNDAGQHWQTMSGPWRDPDDSLEQQEFWRIFYECLAELPPRQARLFALTTFEDLRGEELCKVAGASASNVWVMLHRARLRLRQCLETHWFGRDEAE